MATFLFIVNLNIEQFYSFCTNRCVQQLTDIHIVHVRKKKTQRKKKSHKPMRRVHRYEKKAKNSWPKK